MVAATCVVSHAFISVMSLNYIPTAPNCLRLLQKMEPYLEKKIVKTHLNSKGHIEATKAQRIAALPKLQAPTPMRKAFATGQFQLANKIGKLMLHVYHGANSVTF